MNMLQLSHFPPLATAASDSWAALYSACSRSLQALLHRPAVEQTTVGFIWEASISISSGTNPSETCRTKEQFRREYSNIFEQFWVVLVCSTVPWCIPDESFWPGSERTTLQRLLSSLLEFRSTSTGLWPPAPSACKSRRLRHCPAGWSVSPRQFGCSVWLHDMIWHWKCVGTSSWALRNTGWKLNWLQNSPQLKSPPYNWPCIPILQRNTKKTKVTPTYFDLQKHNKDYS